VEDIIDKLRYNKKKHSKFEKKIEEMIINEVSHKIEILNNYSKTSKSIYIILHSIKNILQ